MLVEGIGIITGLFIILEGSCFKPIVFYSIIENLVLRARSESKGYAEINPTENPGVRIQNSE